MRGMLVSRRFMRMYGRIREELNPCLDIKTNIILCKNSLSQNCTNRRSSADISRIESLYQEFCRLTAVLQEQNRVRKKLASNFAKANEASEVFVTMDDAHAVKLRIERLSEELKKVTEDLRVESCAVPNDTHPDTPIGGPECSEVVDTFGPSLSTLPTKIIDHVELGKKLDIIDFEAGSRTSGSSFYYLKNQGALLEQALVQYALSIAIKRGFKPIIPPDIVNSKFVRPCGFFPRAEESKSILPAYTVEVDGEQDSPIPLKVLAATGEIPLAAYYSGETLSNTNFPLKWVAVSHCFRPETGHHGSDTRGLYRVHQFTKVELFILKDNNMETSNQMLKEIVLIQKEILSSLGLHCRVLNMSTQELGASAYQKYDIEAYFPSRVGWGELTSASNCTDFQSRRLSLKYRPNDGSDLKFAHTLNGTACAVPRVIQAILETHQNSNGIVTIPSVLRRFMLDGSTEIRPIKL